ncbi:MAG TPA: hypothetical protein VE621_18960 [Bryobacteraceae bacterium]|jgi:hypothetical protein|nr:hypothetical protein [Bryobacteraceae bacterium]
MSFRATNFTVMVLLLLAFTIFTMAYRQKRPLDSNVPFIYWILMFLFTLVRPEETWDLRLILVGAFAGLMLRFEFMNRWMARIVQWVEMAVWVYVLYRGCQIIFF